MTSLIRTAAFGRRIGASAVVVALLFLAGCGRGGLGASSASGSTDMAARAGGSSVGGTRTGGVPGGGGAMAQGGSGGTNGPTSCAYICAVDYPCSVTGQDKPKCVAGSPTKISFGTDVSCQEACGTPCCGGGACRIETSDCLPGTLCVYPVDVSMALCQTASQTCGGPSGNTCAADEYCEFFGGQCDAGAASCPSSFGGCSYVSRGAAGVCRPLPSDAECSKLTTPVCGCDGVTYPNDCARRAASVAPDHSGECRGGAGGRGGSAGSGGRGGAGGSWSDAGGRIATGGVRGTGGAVSDARAPTDGSSRPWDNDFCVGQDSQIGLAGKSWTIVATSKWTDPFLSCCVAYAVRLHSREAVGEELEVVLRFSGGSPQAGTYSLGDAPSGVTAGLRSAAPLTDAGTEAQGQVTGGLVLAGAVESAKEAWTLGLCAEVTDPSSRWQGLRIHVPGVAVAPQAWANRFRLWLLKDAALRAADVEGADVNTLELASQPLLDLMDLDFVGRGSTSCSSPASCTWMELNTPFVSGSTLLGNVRGTAPVVDVHGVPFVVEADGERIYLGGFLPGYSSLRLRTPTVMVEEIANNGFPIGAPPTVNPPLPDLRNDPRIVNVLTEAGKLVP